MVARYHIGKKEEVIRRMAEYAIRDQLSLIEALTPRFGKTDEDTAMAIQDAKKCINDFRRIMNVQNGIRRVPLHSVKIP